MSRSKWKGPYLAEKSLEFLQEYDKNYTKKSISRNSNILPQFVNKTFFVYNGKMNNEILVTDEMVGHKFGEFSNTRKKFIFKKKKNKK